MDWPHSQGYQDSLRMHRDPDQDKAGAADERMDGWINEWMMEYLSNI